MSTSENSLQPRVRTRPRGRPKGFYEKTEQNTVKSLDRAMTMLAALARTESATLTDLSNELGESTATLYRVLVTLRAHDIVETDATDQTWRIGPGAFLIGSAFLRRTSLIERSRPVLRRLMEETGETANLGIENDGAVLFVSQVETHAPIRAFFPPGTKSPMHASGIGKVLLADWPARRLKTLTDIGLEGFTRHTITGTSALETELHAVRTGGFAIDDEERNDGMRCIAAPVRNAHGETIAGLSVSGPVSRISKSQALRFSQTVMAAARSVSISLGAPAD